jgi:hypothetical protein
MRYRAAKGRAWEAIKLRVRARETDCYTCPARNLSGANAQCGHFKPVAIVGSNNRWSWDERFIHLQCGRCNGAGQGMAVEYRAHLVLDFGETAVRDFEDSYRKVNPVKDWAALIQAPVAAHE